MQPAYCSHSLEVLLKYSIVIKVIPCLVNLSLDALSYIVYDNDKCSLRLLGFSSSQLGHLLTESVEDTIIMPYVLCIYNYGMS